ncbi:MAG: hypothetical protein WCI89_02010 [bacterium]
MSKPTTTQAKLSHEEFTLKAIHGLRVKPYLGINTVISGFNKAFRDYFGEDPIAATTKLVEQGKLTLIPAKKGVTIYDPKDKLQDPSKAPDAVLAKILAAG